MSDNYFTRGTVIRINSAKADVGVYQLRRYDNALNTVAVGEFSSRIEAEHTFFRRFPLGILAEGNRHGAQQMPTRGHAREYTKNFQEWHVKDAGKLADTARWSVVMSDKLGTLHDTPACVKASESKQSLPITEFLVE